MASYDTLREKYRKRQRDTLIDTITVGLSCADEMMLDLGILDGVGDSLDVLSDLFGALPFLLIVAGEGSKVILGKKDGSSAAKSAAFRAVKSGTAMAIGAGVAMTVGGIAAMPAAVAVHLLFERHKSRMLLSRRLENRIQSVRFLRGKWCPDSVDAREPKALEPQQITQ